jgi:hypothetical protein
MMRISSVHSRRTDAIHRSAKTFIRRVEHSSDAGEGEHCIEGGGDSQGARQEGSIRARRFLIPLFPVIEVRAPGR